MHLNVIILRLIVNYYVKIKIKHSFPKLQITINSYYCYDTKQNMIF